MTAPLVIAAWLAQVGGDLPPDAQGWIKELGIPGALLFAGGWFFVAKYWPWYTKRQESLDAKEEERDRVERERYDRQWAALTQMNEQNADAIKALAAAIGKSQGIPV
ncbi:MAG TPA: hypothetical protein VD932_03205 [Aquabacterium sp.]|nr:hypothetical protein [Aquabacterium sp.]